MRSIGRTVTVLICLLFLLVAPHGAGADPGSTTCLYPTRAERFGVTVYADQEIDWYDVTPLSATRYLNWRADPMPSRPDGMHYYMMIRLSERGYFPSGRKLRDAVRANLNSKWVIGNEADVIFQDNVTPESYAKHFHEVYTTITAIDPTARFVGNGIVQVSPLRLAWLDRVLNAYRTMYNAELPVDYWNVHTYIGNEMHQEWGFEVPPGFANAVGYTGVPDGHQWTLENSSVASGGTFHRSRTPGARAYFAFRGDHVTIFLGTGPDAGIAKIYLDHDSNPVDTVDLYASSPGRISRTFSGLVPPGDLLGDRHNIRVVVTGEKNRASSDRWIRVDEVRASSTAALPGGRFEDNDPLRATIVDSLDYHDDLSLIEDQIRDFRQWMADRGLRDKPLINTEYGILLPEEYGFDYPRVRAFMLESFDLFANNLTDASLGYPEDGNRLLQEWFWFALAVDEFEGQINQSGLFSAQTRQIKPLGVDFSGFVGPLASPYVDLAADRLDLTPTWAIFDGEPSQVHVEALVRNLGNQVGGSFQTTLKEGSTTIRNWSVPSLQARYQPGDQITLQHDWPVVINGTRTLTLVADPNSQVSEPCTDNNGLTATLLAPSHTDLALQNLQTIPQMLEPLPPGQTTTVRLQVDLRNLGAIGTQASEIAVSFWRGDPDAGGTLIGRQTLSPGAAPVPVSISVDWPEVGPGFYDVFAVLDPVPGDTSPDNDRQQMTVIVPTGRLYMPAAVSDFLVGATGRQDGTSTPVGGSTRFLNLEALLHVR